jgi:sugar phosphate isomerase/epimerase
VSFWKLSVGAWIFESKRTKFSLIEKSYPLKEIVERVSQMGIDGLEFIVSNLNGWSKERTMKVEELVESKGLHVTCLIPDTWSRWPEGALVDSKSDRRKEAIEFVAETAEVAKQLGAKLINIWPGSESMISRSNEPYWSLWSRFVESIGKCVDAAADRGLKTTVEYKLRDPAEFQILGNSDVFIRLAEALKSPNLGVCLDTGHAIQCREHLPSVVDKLERWLFHVHLDDNYGDWDDDLPPGYVHNFVRFFNALKRVDYKGYLMFDLYPMGDPFVDLELGKRYVNEICRALT